MHLVIADTGPLNYLILIEQVELLPRLFEKVAIPSAVADELCHEGAPAAVKAWINARPEWLEVHGTEHLPAPVDLDEGKPQLSRWQKHSALIWCCLTIAQAYDLPSKKVCALRAR